MAFDGSIWIVSDITCTTAYKKVAWRFLLCGIQAGEEALSLRSRPTRRCSRLLKNAAAERQTVRRTERFPFLSLASDMA